MNCMAVRRSLQKRQAEKMLHDEVDKYARKKVDQFIEEQNEQIKHDSKYNAMLQVFHIFVILHDDFGFGAKRLGRLFDGMVGRNEEWKADLEDGVAWEKTIKRLKEIGFEFENAEIDMDECRKMDRLYEKGVIRRDKVVE